MVEDKASNCTVKRVLPEIFTQLSFSPHMKPKIDNWSPKKDEFSLILENNILTEFVELNEIDVLKDATVGNGIIQPIIPDNTPADKGSDKGSNLDAKGDASKNPNLNVAGLNINTHAASNINVSNINSNSNNPDGNLSSQQKNINSNLITSITNSNDPAVISQALTELELDDNSIPTKGLNYCQMLCGIIRGALEMVQIQVQVQIVNDCLRPNNELVVNNNESYKNKTQIRVKFIRRMEEAMPVGDG